MKTISLGLCYIWASLFAELCAGDFIGEVSVKYKVFAVFEGDSFEMTCSATHEDSRPLLKWYRINFKAERKNLTGFSNRGKGNTATYRYFKSNAKIADSGDYYCLAEAVGDLQKERMTGSAVPIQVIKKEGKPRVIITKTKVEGKTHFKCEVEPLGRGHLSWHHNGRRLKYKKRVPELELKPESTGEYECRGNLTLGGYTYFISNAYATATAGWSHTTTQTFFTSFLLCFIAFLNL